MGFYPKTRGEASRPFFQKTGLKACLHRCFRWLFWQWPGWVRIQRWWAEFIYDVKHPWGAFVIFIVLTLLWVAFIVCFIARR